VVPNGPGGIKEGLYDSSEWMDKPSIRRIPKFAQFSLAAATQALDDAKWHPESEADRESTGTAIGSSIGGIEAFHDNSVAFNTGGYRKMSPLFIPSLLNNMGSGHVSIKHGLKGPNHSVSTACTTGAHAIGDAANFIRTGAAEVMVAGSSEACIHPLAVAGFARAKSLCTKYNDKPQLASRPFDKERSGFVIGEGAGVMVLEELEHALKRGANIYAEIIGYGATGDAYHITAPVEDGAGAYRSMKAALRSAVGMDPTTIKVDYVNAHATSTPLGDVAEATAIFHLFGDGDNVPYVSSTKGATGHLLGGAGSVEALFTVLSIYHAIMAPTLNLEAPDGPFLKHVTDTSQRATINTAMTNSFGFGGTNASLIFQKYRH
jgi:3-oxoacyl-[acyl-carrier-protein] synthase II